MLKFIKKDHIRPTKGESKFVIYYSVSDLVLGVILISLVSFFIYNYLQVNYFQTNESTYVPTAAYNPATVIPHHVLQNKNTKLKSK